MDFFKFDLRMASYLYNKSDGQCEAYMAEVKNGLAKAIVEGTCFLISIDDSEVPYEHIYDPDFKEFHSKENFPAKIFSLKEFKVKEVYQKVLRDTPYERSVYNERFTVLLWSKYRQEDEFSLNKMRDRLERKFEI